MKPRILVIRGGAIGDFILTLPAIKLLREAFPDAHLEILGYKHIVELAERRFYAEATRSIEYSAMSGFFVPGSELAPDLVEYFASFQQIVSYLYDPSGIFGANLRRAGARNILRCYSAIDDSEHAALQLARPLQSLALYLEDHAATVTPLTEDHAVAERFLAGDTRPIIAVHPGSGSPRKNWPLASWKALGLMILKRNTNTRLLLVGGEADTAQLDGLQQAWQDPRVVLARGLPLPHLGALLARCQLFIGHDSGISHLAAAVGSPCVLLFGPSDPAIWAPTNAAVRIIAAPDGNLTRLDLETVLGAIRVAGFRFDSQT